MPPAAKSAAMRKEATPTTPQPATAAQPGRQKQGQQQQGPDVGDIVVAAFISAHQSTASHTQQKKTLIDLARTRMPEVVAKITALVVRSLAVALPPESQRRHLMMLKELGHAFLAELGDDSMACAVLESLLPFHNAQDKAVRVMVCSVFDILLRELNQETDRGDFYDSVVEAMKLRAHDKIPAVREKAVSCLGVFQAGKKDCDVTHHILAAMCEDSNSGVRRQAVQVGVLRDVYFPSYARMTRDTVAAVRKAAWDQLGKFKFSHIVAYCDVYHVNLCHLIAQGLRDTTTIVRATVSWALCQVWVAKDCHGSCVALLDKFKFRDASDADMMVVAKELLGYHQKHAPSVPTDATVATGTSTVVHVSAIGEPASPATPFQQQQQQQPIAGGFFPLVRDGMTPANLLLWKVSCIAAVETGDPAEEALIPPLAEVASILQSVRATYCKPDRERNSEEKVRLVDNAAAEEVLRILLGIFAVYKSSDRLHHADDTTRASVVKQLAVLLKIVPDVDPGQFVETVVASLKELTVRHASEAITVIDNALHMLFRELRLPKAYDMHFDDVEGFGRRDEERRNELLRLQTRRERGPHVDSLDDDIDTDTKFLLRMMHITRAFLGQCERGDKVPPFCTHMIHLGRQQKDPTVKAIATKALCITCLMSPETVYTFMPRFITDATSKPRNGDSQVIEAAVGGIFDLVCEYGLPFFDTPTQGPPASSRHDRDEDAPTQEASQIDPHIAIEERRRHAEAAVKADDCAKVGGGNLLHNVLLPLLESDVPRVRQLAAFSFCKLLSCNRIPAPIVPHVIAKVLLFHRRRTDELRGGAGSMTAAATAQSAHAPDSPVGGVETEHQVLKTIDCFLASYSYSQPKRMQHVAEGGIRAFRALLFARDPSVAPTAAKLLKKVIVLTDAAFLQQVRDVDPEFAVSFAQQSRTDAEEDDETAEDAQVNSTVINRAARAAAAAAAAQGGPGSNRSRTQLGTARLWRELGRYSLHEWLATELLIDAVYHANDPVLLKTVTADLSSLHLYQRDGDTVQRIQVHVDFAVQTIADDATKTKLKEFAAGYEQLVAQGVGGSGGGANGSTLVYYDEDSDALPAAKRMRWGIDERQLRRTEGLALLGCHVPTAIDVEGVGEAATTMRKSARVSGGEELLRKRTRT